MALQWDPLPLHSRFFFHSTFSLWYLVATMLKNYKVSFLIHTYTRLVTNYKPRLLDNVKVKF